MYNWTNDLPQGSKTQYVNVIQYFKNNYHKVKFDKKINVLEIGTYTGTSLIEIVKSIPNSFGIGVDLWKSYDENNLLSNVDSLQVKNSFFHNVNASELQDRIKGIQSESKEALLQFIKDGTTFDFIYVDGSHLLLDAYLDIVLSWQILDKGGILVIDDYLYKKDTILESPFEAVNHFLNLYKEQYKLLDVGYRVFLQKL